MNHSPFPIPDSPLFILIAGEASGDLLGAGLIKALRERFPEARFAGIGGPQMIAAGLDAWYPAEKLAVMGLVEVLRHLPELLRIRRDVRRRTMALRPDAFIGIDAPDFNLALERTLKRAGFRTIHYVSPSIWAWREKRATRIGQSADRVLCLFPMEPEIYARHGVDARFVGHPLADAFAMNPDQAAARATLGIPADAPVLAMLPGSRLGEIRRLGADFIAAAKLLAQDIPDLHVIAPMANAACRAAFEQVLEGSGMENGESGVGKSNSNSASALAPTIPNSPFPILVLEGRAHEAMIAAEAVLLASGTAALEAMLAKRPMVVAYRLSPLTYRIVKGLGLLKVDRYSLPNHLAGRELVPELMQDACTPDALAAALREPLRTRRIDPALLAEYQRLHAQLGGDADRNAAAAILNKPV
ncbi:lipid-A-disaccharide synthase [Dokdonella sp.]|uniref:lipid-A-disaccharide synthase n=1 Tax=Dokdonella sp. TaxID=2291710 RepID=UPI0037846858